MLKQRVITALIFAASVIALILSMPPWLLAAIFGLLVTAAAYEWAALAGLQPGRARFLYSGAMAVVLLLAGWFVVPLPHIDRPGLEAVLLLAVLAWSLAALAIVSYPRGAGVWGSRLGLAYMGFLVLVPPWLATVYVRSLPHGAYLVIYAIAVIAMADIGAYFSGRALGGPKLMPQVSPAKTWSGLCGGVTLSLLFAWLAGTLGGLTGLRLLSWVALGGLAALVSVCGDLLESMVKRHGGVKDSGSLLPGHGGLFDRLDSLTAGLPVLALGLLYCGSFW